jgi:hypothetical protein
MVLSTEGVPGADTEEISQYRLFAKFSSIAGKGTEVDFKLSDIPH